MVCEKCQSSNSTRIGCCNFNLCTKHIQTHYSTKIICERMILRDWIDKNKLYFPDLFKIQKKLSINEIERIGKSISGENILFLMPKKEYFMFGHSKVSYFVDPQGFFKKHILLIEKSDKEKKEERRKKKLEEVFEKEKKRSKKLLPEEEEGEEYEKGKSKLVLQHEAKETEFERVERMLKMFTVDSDDNEDIGRSYKNLDGDDVRIKYDNSENLLMVYTLNGKEFSEIIAVNKYYLLKNGWVLNIDRPLQ